MTAAPLDWIAAHADRTPERTALVGTETEGTRTYEQFDRRASQVGAFFRDELSLEPGTRVAILAHNGVRYLETLYGGAKAELVYVALNWRLAPPELEYIIDDADPDVLVYEDAFTETVDALRPSLEVDHYVAIGEPAAETDWAYETALESASNERWRMPDRDPDDVWGLLYTSGTTGRPKGVIQTFEMVLYNARNIGIPVGLTARDTTLNVLPFFHTGGLNLYTNPTLITGGTAIVPHRFDPESALEFLEDRVTAFFGVPAIYRAIADHPAFEASALSGVRSWASGGAPMPVDLLERYADHGIVIQQGMGMTETGPTATLIDEARALEKAGSIGKTAPFVRARIVDVDAAEAGETNLELLAAGEQGELQFKGPGITPGYWNCPDAQEGAFLEGWLRTGDIAKRDADGYLYIVDRLKNMFISGGENVFPAEIEHVLSDHPDIAEAAVVPVPHDQWGEVGHAFVVTEADRSLEDEAVLEHCRDNLAKYKVPKGVDFLEELPRNAAGKIDRPELEERVS